MAVKFDKQMLLKHRFWVMLAVAGVLIFTGLLYLEFIYAGVEKDREELVKITKGAAAKGGASPAMIEAMKKKADESVKQETTVWEKAYREQAALFKWEPRVEAKFNLFAGKFALDIKLSKSDDPKSWPADSATLMHGIIEKQTEEGFILRDRNKKAVTFMKTDYVNYVTITDESKQIPLFDVLRLAAGKMAAVTYQSGRYFGDVLTSDEQTLFRTTYKSQIHEILKIVEPLDEKQNGVVQLRDWLYRSDFPDKDVRFLRYVNEEWIEGRPIWKEAWIAQENLWIQKEIYRMIRAANDELSVFQGTGGNEKNKAYTFKNPNFAVELSLDAKGDLLFKIKNSLDRQQSIDLNFRVLLSETPGVAPENIRISGPALKPANTKGDTYTQTVSIDAKSPRNAIKSVNQVLTWQTAAIKRIDHVSIGSVAGDDTSHSNRTYDTVLVPFDKKDLEAPAEAKGFGPGPGGVGPGVGPMPRPEGGGPRPAMGGGIGAGAGGNQGALEMPSLWSFRYMEVTEQSRRVPVAVVLIVDQDHIDRVLTSFNNSKMRFLPTQVLVNQYLGSMQPPAVVDPNGPPGFPGGVGPGPGFGGFGGPGREIMRPPIGGFGGFGGFGGQPGDPGTAVSEPDTNMELVIYGIMTLYQRYPAAPPPPALPVEKKGL